jgi:hypothetical protein
VTTRTELGACRGEPLVETHPVADPSVGADHLRDQRATIDPHLHQVKDRLGVGGEPAPADLPDGPPPAPGRDVDGASLPLRHPVRAEGVRPLVVVIVAHEDHIDPLRVEERREVAPDALVAAMEAARVDRVVEDDEFPLRPGRAQVGAQEGMLGASRRRVGVAVEHRHVRVAEVERVVPLTLRRIVGRRVERVAPWRPARRPDVVIAEARPEHRPPQDARIRREHLRIERLGRPVPVHHVARVQHEPGLRALHHVAHQELAGAAAGVPEHDESVGPVGIVGAERHSGCEWLPVRERPIRVPRPRRESRDRDGARGALPPRQPTRLARGPGEAERAARRSVGPPDHQDGVGGEKLEKGPPHEPCAARPRHQHHCRESQRDHRDRPAIVGRGTHSPARSRTLNRSHRHLPALLPRSLPNPRPPTRGGILDPRRPHV